MGIPILFLVTHIRADFDEVLAIFLLHQLEEAERFFPGANKARVRFWNAGRKTIDGRMATDEWVRRTKILPIGVGGGEFDEHPAPGRPRIEGECAASLVAKKIGVANHPRLQKLLQFAIRVNNTATAKKDDLSKIIKLFHSNGTHKPQEVFDWAWEGIAAKWHEEIPSDDFSVGYIAELLRKQHPKNPGLAEYWLEMAQSAITLDQYLLENETSQEYKKGYTVPFWRQFKGKEEKLLIYVVESDDPRIDRYARSEHGCQAAIVILKRSTGNVVVLSNKYHYYRYHLNMSDVSKVLQIEEALIRGEVPPDWKELKEELQHGVWYYFVPGQSVFNGSHAAPDTPPTVQRLDRIVELVKVALSDSLFPKEYEKGCKSGQCQSVLRRPCPLYHFGLSRCQKIRFYERHPEALVPVVSPEEAAR